MSNIYLDYAAATPLDDRVSLAMKPYLAKDFYNPSATYLAARKVRRDINEARGRIASWLGARPTEIVFTSGATEANNLAISGIASLYPEAEILVSAIEHDSVLAPANRVGAKIVSVTADGLIDLDKLAKAISHQTVLISVMLVNNELGTIQPISEVARLLAKERARRQQNGVKLPIYLHTDAAQAANYLDLHVSRLGVDLMSINGGKIYGPKQTGLLYVATGVELQPLIVGGGQERNLRSGTENVAGIIGLAIALDLAQSERKQVGQHMSGLRDQLADKITAAFPAAIINGGVKHRSPHILSVSFPGQDNERLMMQLDEAGIQVAVGSACSASSDEPSHVLAAIGLEEAAIRSSLRFSLGRQTTTTDIDKVAERLAEIIG